MSYNEEVGSVEFQYSSDAANNSHPHKKAMS